jgi:hypothetical protein
MLVSVGVGLVAREFGLLPAHVRVLDFWPLFIVLIGVSVLRRASGVVSALLALAFIATGAALLAGNLGFLSSSVNRLWPVLIVLLGPEMMDPEPQPDLGTDPTWRESASMGRANRDQTSDQDRLIRQYTCAGAQVRIESQTWKGGEIGVTAGGVELDLRQARLDPAGALLVLRVLMGGVEIRVPDTWHVQLDVTPLLGGADDSTRSTQGASSAPHLRIVGNVTLGGVNVQN